MAFLISVMSFSFKQFHIDDSGCAMKVGTDSVLLGAWASVEQARRIADIGAGSGLLSLICAQRNPDAMITAVEIDPAACDCARLNFAASPWSQRLEAACADALQWTSAEKYDFIISNPPYFTSALQSPCQARAKARHATDSLGPVSLMDVAARCLSPVGVLAMVTPADMEKDLIYEAAMRRLNPVRLCRVRSSQSKPASRLLSEWSFRAAPLSHEEIVIASPEYRALTSPFYINM